MTLAVILAAVVLPIILKVESNFEVIHVHYHFGFLKSCFACKPKMIGLVSLSIALLMKGEG